MNLGTAQVIRADSRHLPLADDSVDLVVTSPPYFALRSYQDGGEHYEGQVGSEGTPAEFVDALLEVTRECVRVLKSSGSLWVNLGDKYAQPGKGERNGQGIGGSNVHKAGENTANRSARDFDYNGVRGKSLIGIPWRYALRCIDDLGLILRAEVIWSKPNGLPESVTDRVRRSHEQWFCFEQSGGVEAATQSFPFCPLCGRPVDARSTLVARLKELDGSVQPRDLAHHVGTDDRVDGQDAGRGDHDVAVGADGAAVPVLEALDAEARVDAADLVEHGIVSVVDADAQQRAALTADQGDCALPVDDPSEPTDVCECVGHPLILNDEPWIPQSLAAELMQMVADGTADPQHVADYLAGDYARNHSVWFHFTLEPRYFSAVDEIREAHQATKQGRSTEGWRPGPSGQNRGTEVGRTHDDGDPLRYFALSPLGKLPGSVWEVPTEPLRVPDHLGIDHFAAFPTEFPRRIIQGWSPAGICVECGEGRRPVVHKGVTDFAGYRASGGHRQAGNEVSDAAAGMDRAGAPVFSTLATITGYACACPEPTAAATPAVVLDPFGGTGTTAMVAKALGRHGITVDMSADYCRLADWRTNDRNQLAKVLGIEKAEQPDEAQMDLFDLGEPA